MAADSDFYVKAARDLYSAARRDLEAGRDERAGELARAAEAMTHVPEHLAQVANARGQFGVRPAAPLPPEGPEPKTKGFDPRGPEPKAKGYMPIVPGGADLPPILPPR